MPAKNKLDLEARQRAALRVGKVGSKPYKASMQASLKFGTGKTKSTSRPELQAIVRLANVKAASARNKIEARAAQQHKIEARAAQQQEHFAAETALPRGSKFLYGPVEEPIPTGHIPIKLVVERYRDTPENRAEAILRAQELQGQTAELAGGKEANVCYVAVTWNPAGEYPRDTFINPKDRNKPRTYEYFDDFIEVEVWVEIEGT